MTVKLARRPTHSEDARPTDRMRTASAKARDAFLAVARRARTLTEELDEAGPQTITAELHEEDSAVIVVHEMIGSLAAKI
jgi:hypothetical protein